MKAMQTYRRFTGILIVVFLFSGFTAVFAQHNTWFEEANELYNQGEYEAAIERYEKISEAGKHSAALYFNMANAYYKLNRIAPSILNYERALLLDPEDKDIGINLAYARNMTIDDIDELPKTGISRLVNGLIGTFSYRVWTWLAIGLMSLFVLFFIWYYFAVSQGKKRMFFTLSGLMLILSVLSLVFAFQQRNLERSVRPAIVFAEETTVKSEPNLGSEEVFRLHEGTKVFILDTLHNWKKIRLADGKIGWLPADELRAVKDF